MTDQDLSPTRRQLIVDVSRQGLVFAEQSAAHMGAAVLDEPDVQIYYLVYVLGAIEHFGQQLGDAEPLNPGETLGAMAEALAAFDNATAEEIRQTVMALNAASGDAAQTLRQLGRDMAAVTTEDPDLAQRRFSELLKDRAAHLPVPLEPILAPLATTGGAT
ncbi:MAG: hypothetical protein AB8G16_05540 [Gammaproteobacteria bacterium]